MDVGDTVAYLCPRLSTLSTSALLAALACIPRKFRERLHSWSFMVSTRPRGRRGRGPGGRIDRSAYRPEAAGLTELG